MDRINAESLYIGFSRMDPGVVARPFSFLTYSKASGVDAPEFWARSQSCSVMPSGATPRPATDSLILLGGTADLLQFSLLPNFNLVSAGAKVLRPASPTLVRVHELNLPSLGQNLPLFADTSPIITAGFQRHSQ